MKGNAASHRASPMGNAVRIAASISCVTCTFLVLLTTVPHPARAAEDGVRTTIERRYEYLEGDALPEIGYSIRDDEGNTYRLSGRTTSPVDGYVAPMRDFSRQVDFTIAPDQVDTVTDLLDGSLPIDDDGFIGSIPLTGYTLDPIMQSLTRGVDRVAVYDSLPSNDVALLPQEAEFTVSSDEGEGATTPAVLQRAGVIYTVEGTDAGGVPDLFRATVTYRGIESYLQTTGYQVHASYGGTVGSSRRMLCTTATYTLVASDIQPRATAIATAALDTADRTAERASQADASMWAPGDSLLSTIVLTGVCALLAGIAVIVLSYRGRRGNKV